MVSKSNICGLYSGGTLAYECMFMLEEQYGYMESNLSKKNKVANPQAITAHTTIDFGEDEYTVGRAHPMIDPTLRHEVFVNAIRNKNIAVLVLDMVLGYGANMQPQKVFVDSLRKMKGELALNNRHIFIIVNIVGSDNDPQNYRAIVRDMESVGAIIAPKQSIGSKVSSCYFRECKLVRRQNK